MLLNGVFITLTVARPTLRDTLRGTVVGLPVFATVSHIDGRCGFQSKYAKSGIQTCRKVLRDRVLLVNMALIN